MQKRGILDKKGQVTLFVIIAILIVAVAALLIFLLPKTLQKTPRTEVLDPKAYISSCVNDELGPLIETIAKQGGSLELDHCIFYKDVCRTYLCYQSIPYTACVNQEPMLKEKIESVLKTKLQQENTIQSCISNFKQVATQKGYFVSACNNPQFNVELIPEKVTVPINCSISLDRNEEHKRFTTITPALDWPLYNFILISKEMINTEIQNTDFDPVTYMLLNNWIEIEKFRSSDEVGTSKIYILKERSSGKEFGFALKNNYWIPAGIL